MRWCWTSGARAATACPLHTQFTGGGLLLLLGSALGGEMRWCHGHRDRPSRPVEAEKVPFEVEETLTRQGGRRTSSMLTTTAFPVHPRATPTRQPRTSAEIQSVRESAVPPARKRMTFRLPVRRKLDDNGPTDGLLTPGDRTVDGQVAPQDEAAQGGAQRQQIEQEPPGKRSIPRRSPVER